MSLFRKLMVPAVLLGLAACSSVPKLVNEYRIDVQQGNVITQDMVAQLRPGLTRDQVRYALGSPVLTDIFHNRRWDYVYHLQRGTSEQPLTRRFAVFFDEAGLLVRVAGDLEAAQPADLAVPASRVQIIDLGSAPEAVAETAAPKVPAEKGWLGRMMEKVGL
jgi:outer membrane protein assembly factor BamE